MAALVGHDLLELLECKVCFETMYPPIYQCPNGHTLCSNCKPSIRNICPTCRHEMGDIRSLALEQIAASMHLPCRYHETGCTWVYRYDKKKEHEEECKFRPFNCPCLPCVMTGDAVNIAEHLKDDHSSAICENCEIDKVFHHECPYNEEPDYSNITVYRCLGEHFCLHCEAFRSPSDLIYMTFITFMGGEVEAMNFRYSLEVGNDGEKIEWQGIPRSIREGVVRIRDSFDGLIVHCNAARYFSEIDNQELRIWRVTGQIWREEN